MNENDTAGEQKPLETRLERIEEALGDIKFAHDISGEKLLRGRVKRLEEAVAEIQHAQGSMDQSLRILSLASLTIKRALGDVVRDLASIPGL